MIIKQTNRTGADAIFVSVRNVSGATLSAGAAVELDVTVATDGNAVTSAKSGSLAGLFVGVTDQSLADSAYGLVQTYGYRQSAYVSAASAGSTPGTFLVPTSGILVKAATMSAATTSGHIFAALAETVSSSATANANIFLRAN
jgi:hypothetical protein